jgi:uncharacterized protein with beta-barrel porin domain
MFGTSYHYDGLRGVGEKRLRAALLASSALALASTLPGSSFVVNGAAQARDAALTTASAEVKWRNGFAIGATFEGEFSNVTRSSAGKGVVRYVW